MGATAQPATTPGQNVVGAILDVFNVVHEPAAVFRRIKERPRVLVPWLTVAALLIVFAVLVRPYQAAAMATFRASLPPEQAARMGDGGQSVVRVALTVPIVFIIGLAVGAGLLWLGVALSGSQARYKMLMSVLAYCCVAYVVFMAVSTAVLMTRGIEQVTDFADLRAPIGLDVFVPGASLFLGTILNGLNPFAVWGVWLTGTGLSVTHGMSRAAGIVVTTFAYVLCLFLQAAPLIFLSMALKR
jgi:hypothetical protein